CLFFVSFTLFEGCDVKIQKVIAPGDLGGIDTFCSKPPLCQQPKNGCHYELVPKDSQGCATDCGNLSCPVEGLAPAISDQPKSISATVGANISFNVTVTGSAPMTYQWR